MKKKTLTFKLSGPEEVKLAKLAKSLKKPKSALIRLAVEALLKEPAVSDSLSAYGLLQDYCGVLDNLPTDLSSDKKYMQHYGK